jgi:hypothetical protein
MKVEVRLHKEDLRKVVEVDEDEFPIADTSTNTREPYLFFDGEGNPKEVK